MLCTGDNAIGNTVDKIKRAHSQHFVITENWFDGDVMVVNTKKNPLQVFRKRL